MVFAFSCTCGIKVAGFLVRERGCLLVHVGTLELEPSSFWDVTQLSHTWTPRTRVDLWPRELRMPGGVGSQRAGERRDCLKKRGT